MEKVRAIGSARSLTNTTITASFQIRCQCRHRQASHDWILALKIYKILFLLLFRHWNLRNQHRQRIHVNVKRWCKDSLASARVHEPQCFTMFHKTQTSTHQSIKSLLGFGLHFGWLRWCWSALCWTYFNYETWQVSFFITRARLHHSEQQALRPLDAECGSESELV